jgi:hypothetical protein
MASRLSSVTIGHRPPFRYFSLVGFHGVTYNLDHPLAAEEADDSLIEMQRAVDEGLDCIERIAGEMEED